MKCDEMFRDGRMREQLTVRQIQTPGPARKKIPVRFQVRAGFPGFAHFVHRLIRFFFFQAKIRELEKPVVGLCMIDEFIPIYDDEMEPYYKCNICGKIGEANMMATHVMALSHIQKTFEKMFPEDPKFIDMPRAELEELVDRFKENDKLYLVNTFRSDLLFPWPDRKAPWAVEQGGDGIVPPYARELIKSSELNFDDHPVCVSSNLVKL